MDINPFISIPVTENSQVAEARRVCAKLATQAGFSEEKAGKLAIAASEAATNLVKHGGGGEILTRLTHRENESGVELLALDKGPGMADTQKCMEDGYSTAGSPGTGLGAIVRQAAFFDMYSLPGKGTAMFAQFWTKPQPSTPSSFAFDVGGVAVPKRGESACGDGWIAKLQNQKLNLLISDGLGHGDAAANASAIAMRIFSQDGARGGVEWMKVIHEALKSTRGAAVAVLEADMESGILRYAGVGNTMAAVVATGVPNKHMVSHNGTLGHSLQRVQEFTYDWPQGAIIVLTTDGLVTQWSLEGYPGLARLHPVLLAAILYRDFQRGRDDATVVVVKRREEK